MDKLEDALKRCPELVVVHVATYAQGETEPKYWEKPDVNTHKVRRAKTSRETNGCKLFLKISLDLYRRESVKICSLMKELLPTGEVGMSVIMYCYLLLLSRSLTEKASVDEAFIDLSIPVRNALLERYPYLANPPTDAKEGLDSALPSPPRVSFAGLGNLIPIDSSLLAKDAKETTEAVEEAEQDLPVTWHDVGLQIAAEIMAHVRKEVHDRLGYFTSAVCTGHSDLMFPLLITFAGYRAKQIFVQARSFIPQVQYPEYPTQLRNSRLSATHALPKSVIPHTRWSHSNCSSDTFSRW